MSTSARFRYTVVAGATAVVIGTGFMAVGLNRHPDAGTTTTTGSRVADTLPVAAAGSTPPPVAQRIDDATGASVGPSEPPAPSRSAAGSAAPSKGTAEKSTVVPSLSTPSRPAASTAAPAKVVRALAAPETGGTVLDQVLAHINAARAAAGLTALTLDTNLSQASALHNQLMIDGCGLAHQCAGEGSIGPRFTAQGVRWTSAGENIGFGSSGPSDADLIKAANGLTDNMLAEVPPNDGHRKNLLNTGFKRIGLSVVRDAKGITWMTQDFVN